MKKIAKTINGGRIFNPVINDPLDDVIEIMDQPNPEHKKTTFPYVEPTVQLPDKIKKKFLYPATRRRIVVDESRFLNMTNNFTYGEKKNLWQKRLSLIDGYLWNPRNFGTQDTFDFNTLTRDQRKDFIDFLVHRT